MLIEEVPTKLYKNLMTKRNKNNKRRCRGWGPYGVSCRGRQNLKFCNLLACHMMEVKANINAWIWRHLLFTTAIRRPCDFRAVERESHAVTSQ